jgi:hypothetical protein
LIFFLWAQNNARPEFDVVVDRKLFLDGVLPESPPGQLSFVSCTKDVLDLDTLGASIYLLLFAIASRNEAEFPDSELLRSVKGPTSLSLRKSVIGELFGGLFTFFHGFVLQEEILLLGVRDKLFGDVLLTIELAHF